MKSRKIGVSVKEVNITGNRKKSESCQKAHLCPSMSQLTFPVRNLFIVGDLKKKANYQKSKQMITSSSVETASSKQTTKNKSHPTIKGRSTVEI